MVMRFLEQETQEKKQLRNQKKKIYYIDNNKEIWEKEINGIYVKNFNFYINDTQKADIIIVVFNYIDIQNQLEANGIHNYSFFPQI